MTEPEKLDLRSHDIAEDKKQELLRLFPEIRTEDGKIDFERLKLTLGEMVDVGKERYGMNWPGKADCFKTIQAPSLGTLRPCREESINFDTTENLIIEGDNLEVLKLLQKSYLGKVKMIYIVHRTTRATTSSIPTTTPRACKPTWNTRAKWMQKEKSSAPTQKPTGGFTPSG
jgi:adenine-specific DNA-methyltransferase